MKDLEKIRTSLNKIKLKGFNNLLEDHSNLNDILSEYDKIAEVAKDLVDIKNTQLKDSLASQPMEYSFFRRCVTNIKGLLDYYDAAMKYERGKFYNEIRVSNSRELNDRAINQVIDGKDEIFQLTNSYLCVKETYDRFIGIVESYNQRGYALNNITKALEASVMDTLL